MHSFVRRVLPVTLTLLFATGAAFAQNRVLTKEEALRQDASSYARSQKVSVREAVRRLKLQKVIGQLNASLTEAERGSFAGLWIEHSPKYRVVARFTDDHAKERVAAYVAGTELEGLIDVEPATFSWEELEAVQASTHHLVRQLGVRVDSEINVKTNWVQVYSVHPEELAVRLKRAGMELPAGAVVQKVKRLILPEADIYGGLPISTCTTGFSVQNGSGTRGVLTAAHCSNTQSYSGSALTYQSGDITGNQDVQWHTAPGFTVTNQFDSGIGIRSCTATESRSNQAVGDYVCKNGKTTGYACGSISSTTLAPSHVTSPSATFIRVNNDQGYANLSSGGDSGGPWFLDTTAYGIHSAEPSDDTGDAVYMAINYISSLGVSVLTAP